MSGIPQGSVLGPILFVLYINDLPESTSSPTVMFADDTKVYRKITNQNDEMLLQEDLNNLMKWSDKWLLRFHPKKCKVMTVSTNSRRNPQYQLNDKGDVTRLENIASEKDLGVVVDQNLSFSTHIQQIINKANSIVGVKRRSFVYLDENMFTNLFKALIRPHLEYAASIWNPYKVKDIETIENVQRRSTKLLPGFKQLSYSERLRKLKLPTLAYR